MLYRVERRERQRFSVQVLEVGLEESGVVGGVGGFLLDVVLKKIVVVRGVWTQRCLGRAV